jgi:glycosyltransferase involved in cell wall biosynthesis
MHIVHIISNLEVGGAQFVMLNLAKSLTEQGHKVSIISILKTDKQTIDIPTNINCLTIINNTSLKNNVLKSLAGFKKVKKIINKLQPDIVHNHLFLPKLFLIGINKFTIIDTHHDNSPWWSKNDLRSKLFHWVEKYFINHKTSHTIAISKAVKFGLINYYHADEKNITIIYNSISIQKDSCKIKKTPSAEHLLYVGRLSIEKKGLDTLVEIVKLLIKDFPQLKVTIVGDGDDRYKFEQLISKMNLTNHFTLEGIQKNVERFYSNATILIMPSRWEGFGLTAAEAAICGVPVVASDIGGLNEVVIDNVTGFTVPSDKPDKFADNIKVLINDKELYTKFSRNALKLSKERYNHDDFIIKCLKVYNYYNRLKN